jgi:hypothetical protein
MLMVIKLMNYLKYSFTPLTLLLLSAVIVLAIVAFFPSGIFAQEQKAAEITSPAPGSTLEGSTAAFAWSAGSQAEVYFLYLGTTPGENNLYGQSQGLNREVTVSGLPVDGSIIYIRLWSLLPTGWFFADTSVLAAAPWVSPGDLVLVKEKLKKMNELLQKAIDDYRNGVIEGDELRKRIDEIIKLKYEAINGFPDVWGQSFGEWYSDFERLDRYLNTARNDSANKWISEKWALGALERAKTSKEFIEKILDRVLIN